MNIAFRVDASSTIGIGHFMRCLALAHELRKNGSYIRFVVRYLPKYLADVLSMDAIECIHLEDEANNFLNDLSYASWLGVSQEQDARSTMQSLSDRQWDWLIVDHYAIGAPWEQALRSVCHKLMVIDDLADRQHECDLLLDQTLGRTRSDYIRLVPDDCAVLTGPQYALLRPEFAEFRRYSLRRRTTSKIERLLVTMGGIDKGNATGKTLEALKDCSLPRECRITVILGLDSPWLSCVNDLAANMPWPTKVKVNVQNMAELMANSDLVIGAAGITSWERCCLGLPSLIVVLAQNQLEASVALKKSGCAKVLGTQDEISKNLRLLLQELTINQELAKMTQASYAITDGQGVNRIKRIILENYAQ